MFFILSKVLFFLLRPINWMLGLLIWAWFTKDQKRRRRLLGFSILLYLFLGNHVVFNTVVRWWEPETIQLNAIQDTFDIAILLGGYSNFDIVPDQDRHNFNYRANRFTNTYELYKKGLAKKILLTGGSGEIFNQSSSEGKMVQQFLLRLGVPAEDIIIEPDSRNTYENGIFTQKILQERFPDATCLLLTSAWHMPRSQAIFRKLKIPVTPVCVDYLSEHTSYGPEEILQPNRHGFYHWEILVKEWVGYIVYKCRGFL